MKRAIIITGPGFQDHDVIYTYYRCKEEGLDIDIATRNAEPVCGKYGVPLPMDKTSKANVRFEGLTVADYDAVILTGGHEAPDRVRQDQSVLSFVRQMTEARKIVAGLCHGPWIMISAGIMRGRKACAYVGLKDDMRNAGAILIEDAHVVADDNVITCSYYGYAGEFMRAVFTALTADGATIEAG